MKRLLIGAVMCLLLSMNVLANEPGAFLAGDFWYDLLDDGTAEITKYCGDIDTEELIVPDQIDGYKVTSIGKDALFYYDGLKTIKLPESINNLDSNPILFCGDVRFSISPDHPYLAVIDGVLFTKPDKRLICCPDTKESYSVPDGIEIIGECAFYGCRSLNSITLPNSVTSIEICAFSNCSGLSSITLPDNLISIGDYAFSDCSSLNSMTLPDSVTSIGSGVYGRCSSLSSIKLPESITNMGANPFRECGNINILVSPDHPYLAVIDGVLFSKPDKRLICCPDTKESYAVPDGIEIIGDDAFNSSYSLISITIPNSVTSIGNSVFFSCNGLSSVILPESVTSIGDSAFSWCSSLSSITLSDNVTNIGLWAFFECENLTVTVSRDSYAVQYCEENDLNYTYPDSNDWLKN